MKAVLLALSLALGSPEPPPASDPRDEMIQRLHRDKPTEVDTELSLKALKSFALAALAVVALALILRPWIMRRREVRRQPLRYEKIVTDESNVRHAVRVELIRPLVIENLRSQGRAMEFSGRAASLDLSLGGMSFLSSQPLPQEADLGVSFRESEIATSPSLGSVVLQCQAWNGTGSLAPEQLARLFKDLGQSLHLVRVSFVNLSPEARRFLSRLVTSCEREMLAAKKIDADDADNKATP